MSGFIIFSATCLAACSSGGGASATPEQFELGGSVSNIISGIPATAYHESALLNLYSNGRLYAACSGSIIAPRVVLTAGHCVEGVSSWRIIAPFANNQTVMATTSARYDWNNGGSEQVNPNQHDIGLIFLPTPITLAAYPQIANSPVSFGSSAVNVGRIQSGSLSDSALFVGKSVALHDGGNVGFPFDYNSTDVIEPGDSGGPVIVSSAGVHTIVAVNSGAGGGNQVLARTDLLATWIAQQIAANGGMGTGANPADAGSPPASADGGATTTAPPPAPSPAPTAAPGAGACSPEHEPNDNSNSANPLAGSVCGTIGPSGDDQDWFTWNAASAGVPYDVKLDATGDAQLFMWKFTNNQCVQVQNTSPTESAHTSSGPGTYVVGVASPTGTVQAYRISLVN